MRAQPAAQRRRARVQQGEEGARFRHEGQERAHRLGGKGKGGGGGWVVGVGKQCYEDVGG